MSRWKAKDGNGLIFFSYESTAQGFVSFHFFCAWHCLDWCLRVSGLFYKQICSCDGIGHHDDHSLLAKSLPSCAGNM